MGNPKAYARLLMGLGDDDYVRGLRRFEDFQKSSDPRDAILARLHFEQASKSYVMSALQWQDDQLPSIVPTGDPVIRLANHLRGSLRIEVEGALDDASDRFSAVGSGARLDEAKLLAEALRERLGRAVPDLAKPSATPAPRRESTPDPPHESSRSR